MEEGGLWIHAPVAPTEECIRLVEELAEEVRYIVLPTTAVRVLGFFISWKLFFMSLEALFSGWGGGGGGGCGRTDCCLP